MIVVNSYKSTCVRISADAVILTEEFRLNVPTSNVSLEPSQIAGVGSICFTTGFVMEFPAFQRPDLRINTSSATFASSAFRRCLKLARFCRSTPLWETKTLFFRSSLEIHACPWTGSSMACSGTVCSTAGSTWFFRLGTRRLWSIRASSPPSLTASL